MSDADFDRPDSVAAAMENWRGRGWDEAALGMGAITSVLRAYRLYLAQTEVILSPYGLNYARYEVLMLLYFSKTMSLPLGVISDRLQLYPATITNTINRLEDTGFVRRETSETDRRVTLAVLQRPAIRRLEQAAEALNSALFANLGLDDEELSMLQELMFKLRRRLAKQDDAAIIAARGS